MKTLTVLTITLAITSLIITSCGKQNDVVPMEQAVSASENSTVEKHSKPAADLNQAMIDPLSNYPDPFLDKTTITYRIEKTSKVRLAIVNAKGERIDLLASFYAEPGVYSVVFDASYLPAGFYTAILTTDSGQIRERMEKLHATDATLPSDL